MTEETHSVQFSADESAEVFTEIGKHVDMPMTPQHGISALAMNMALKFMDLNTLKDGTLYQQLKLEGKNIRYGWHLDEAFYIAQKIELHILNAPNRLTEAVYQKLTSEFIEDLEAAAAELSPAEGDADAADTSARPAEPREAPR